MRYRGRNRLPRWVACSLIVAALIALPLVAVSANQQERFASLTIEQLLGIRVDAESPPSGLPLPRSGLVLGLGADLTLLGGDLSVRAFPRSPSVTVSGTTLLTTGPVRSLCYIITAYIDDQEFLFWRDALLAVLGSDGRWSIQLEWATVPELTHLVRFGMRTGFRVYRRSVPANELGVVCQTVFSDLRLVEEFPSDPNQSTVVFTDGGTSGGKPAIGPPGPLSLTSTPGNLAVDNVASLGALQVGSVGAPALGNAAIQSNLTVGNNARVANSLGIGAPPVAAARLNIADSSRANIYLDATLAPSGKNWELASTGAGDFSIDDAIGVGAFCAGGSPRFVITSAGVVGIGALPGMAPPAPSGSLEVAHALGVGTAVPAAAGCGDVRVGGTLLTQWIAPLVAGRLININGGIATTADVVVGGVLCGLGGDPVSICAAKVLGDLETTGKMVAQRIEALNQGQLMQLDGGITITKDLVLGGTLSGLAGAPVTMNAARVLADTTVEGTLITQRIEALNQGQLMQLDGGITITKDLVLGGTLSGLAGAPVAINAADIAADLTVGRDANVLNDLVVANNADVLNDLSVLNDAEVLGDLTVWGRKFFAQPHPTDSTKVITYAALEGPEAGTYVRGTAQLVDGQVTIELPESFRLVTAEEGLTAQVTLLDDCSGLYVAEKSTARIVIKELMNGTSDARLDYLVQGVRKGYGQSQAIQNVGGE